MPPDDVDDAEELAQSTMGGEDHANPVHITSNDFAEHHQEEVDEEDADDVDDEHDYEIGSGIHDMAVR